MKRLLFICAILFVLLIGCKVNHDNKLKAEWEHNREVITVVVHNGDTLWDITNEYRPTWMTADEYMYDIKQLNDMTTSNLCVGDRLKVYVMGGAY